jgi:hypothetical protein
MLDGLDEVSDKRVKALGEIERDKLRVAKAYKKRVKKKLFQVGDLVWKMILPIGSRSKVREVVSKLGRTIYNRGSSCRKFLYGLEYTWDLTAKSN